MSLYNTFFFVGHLQIENSFAKRITERYFEQKDRPDNLTHSEKIAQPAHLGFDWRDGRIEADQGFKQTNQGSSWDLNPGLSA